MQRKLRLIMVLTVMALMLNVVNVSATVLPVFEDYVTVTVTEDGTDVHVVYVLTALATGEGYTFAAGSPTTTINGVAMDAGADISKSIVDLGITKGSLVTGNFSATLVRTVAGENETLTLFSDGSESVRVYNADTSYTSAVVVTNYEHQEWRNKLDGTFNRPTSGINWIWNADPMNNTDVGETLEFTRTFNVSNLTGTPTLLISADNEYTVDINGTPVGADTTWTNAETYNVTLTEGQNTLHIVAKNIPLSGNNGTPSSNPGGVIYLLTYEQTTTDTEELPLSTTFEFAVEEDIPEAPSANLWISADDHADVYVDGEKYVHNQSYSKAVEYTLDNADPFFAVKAWDNTGVANIAGFKLVYQSGEETFQSTDNTWYYRLDNEDINAPDLNGNYWYEEDYAANGWASVTAFTLAQAPTPRNWAPDSDFPDASAKWIWGPNFDVPTASVIDSPVYLRPMAPKAIYTVSFDTLDGTPTPDSYDVASGTIISAPVEVPVLADHTFEGWDYDFNQAIVGNTTITAVYLPIERETPEQPELPTPTTPETVNYDLTVTATEGGTVPGFLGTNTFASGTNVNLAVTVEDGYEFVGFTGEVVDGVVTMNADKAVVATFAPIEVIIDEEETPEATPDEEILDEVTPEASPEDSIPDEALPQTGGIPAGMMSLFGIAMTGVGFKIKKRK